MVKVGALVSKKDPLHIAIQDAPKLKNRRKKEKSDREDAPMDIKTSKKILELAREQQEIETTPDHQVSENFETAPAIDDQKSFKSESDSESEEEFDQDAFEAQLEIDNGDAAIIDQFRKHDNRNLSDLIMAKLAGNALDTPQNKEPEIDPKIVEVYTKVGAILSRYRSGKLPKVFKIIPSFPNWEQILFLTNPQGWTPHATYQATRIFVSNLQSRMAQKFFSLFLLDKIRDDIAETKKLNAQLYMALKKSLYKPAAFFKGLLLPLLESGTCTLREAAIIGSVITRVSIPLLDSAAALLKIAEMEYSGPNSLFIRILLDKKYALPYKAIDAVVFHFTRFLEYSFPLPVLWHQSLLVFAQRYKSELVPEQKDALMELLRAKNHPQITDEIRREIVNSKCRGDLLDLDMMEA